MLFSNVVRSQAVDTSYVGTGKSWWSATAYYHDPNTKNGYEAAFDEDRGTKTEAALFKRYGNLDTPQGMPIITAFNFNKPFTGKIRLYMTYSTSPQGLSPEELYEVGDYSISFMCAFSLVERDNSDDFIILPDKVKPSYIVKEESIKLSEVPDNGLLMGFSLDVQNCHGLMLREISTSMISIKDGRFNSYVIFRQINEIEFLLPNTLSEEELDAKDIIRG